MRLSWTKFKAFTDARQIPIHECPLDDTNYLLQGFDGPIIRTCKIRNGTADYTDYTTNYQSNSNPTLSDDKGASIVKVQSFANADGFSFKGKGTSGTATAGTTSDIDYKFTEELYTNGADLILNNNVIGDKITIEIIDIDGVYYPANTVLSTYVKDWYISPASNYVSETRIEYPSKIAKDLYFRVKYTSTGGTDVIVYINLFLHKKS